MWRVTNRIPKFIWGGVKIELFRKKSYQYVELVAAGTHIPHLQDSCLMTTLVEYRKKEGEKKKTRKAGMEGRWEGSGEA
jgi:hypothetical protein